MSQHPINCKIVLPMPFTLNPSGVMYICIKALCVLSTACTTTVDPSVLEAVNMLLSFHAGDSPPTTTVNPLLPSILRPRTSRKRVHSEVFNLGSRPTRAPDVRTTRSAAPAMPQPAVPVPSSNDTWAEIPWLSSTRPKLFLLPFRPTCKIVIVKKMIDTFQSLISVTPPPTPRGSLPQHIEPLMDGLRARVRRACSNKHDGWEYDLDDFVYYILSKRRIDIRIHEILTRSARSLPPPDLFTKRLQSILPDIVIENVEHVIDWFNNVVIPQQGSAVVVLNQKFAVMTVEHFVVHVLKKLQNELVQSVRHSRINRKRQRRQRQCRED